ncbi:RNA-binding (RRM/RBD/RNP motif) family protein [Medicago truncatula]|uniref:RNA-binding (RRM/RBD/RNP motif) family protein n=1 Tax=Medicago truncatula TaxID=3880 RepID=A0A072TNH8_MEDTR|nr:RNA-binding (RRM/RBD/RNP motif) family protein [Medicago truncatula]
MGNIDRSDNRSFQTNFTDEGIAVLTETLNEKLKELMGDTDEILVNYVIVLLKNGKAKNQAKNDLNLFLGDDSDSFVSWLWDHLALNIDLYVQSKGLQDEAPKSKVLSKAQAGDDDFQSLNQKSESVKSRSRRNKDWNGLVGRDAEAPPLLSFVVDNMHLDKKDQSKVNGGPKAPSLAPPVQRKKGCAVEQQKVRKRGCAVEQQKTMKRGCAVEQQKTKRDSVSQVTIDAPRRLLQFAVRDAVASSNLGTTVEPSLKRLRAAVSSSYVESSMVEHPHRMQTISNLVKFKSSGSAFDPIDCDIYPSYGNVQLEDNQYQEESPYGNVQLEDNQYQEESPFLYHEKNDYDDQYAANMTMLDYETGFQFEDNQYQEESPFLYHEKNDYGDQYAANMTTLDHETGFQFEDNQYQEESSFLYHEKTDYGDQYPANMTTLDHETGFQFEDNQYEEESPFLYHEKNDFGDQYAANMTGVPSDSSSDNEGFDDVNFMGNRVGRVSQFSSSGGKRGEYSLMGNYSAAKNDDSILLKKNRNQDQSAAAPNSSKIVNISVNVNAWNPPVPKQYAKPRKVADLSGHKTLNSGTRAPKSGLSMVNENAKTVKIDSGKAKPTLDLLKVTQKAQPSTPGTGKF